LSHNIANEIEKRNEAFLIYQDENGIARVNVRFEGEDVWLLQEQIRLILGTGTLSASKHQTIEQEAKAFMI